MIRRASCLVVLLGWGALSAPAAEPAKGALDNLVKNSPFGSSAAPGGAGAENAQLEFRGTFTDQGEQYFSFFDPASRTSQWVGLKETGAPYSVQSYDSATQSVKVLFRNQTFNLALKRAQIVLQALPPPLSPSAGAPAGPAGQPTPAVVSPGSADEAARLAQVAEEIRRRRALRAQGNQPTPVPPPAPQPSSSGSPPPGSR